MQINIAELNKRKELGLLSCRKHPTEDLYIWNYTPRCQFDNIWDEYTMMCRGLVTDSNGLCYAIPFKKFFSVNQCEETKIENLPNEIPLITEKLDGSLIIIFDYKGKTIVATRGSFESEQAIWATNWFREKRHGYGVIVSGYTYLMECIYKNNRIVVDYGDREELVLLTIIDNRTGGDVSQFDINFESQRVGINRVRIINRSIADIVRELETMNGNEEGFVALYSNGLRCKFKGREYLRLHKILTGFSSKSIWECLKSGQDIEAMLYAVPDEFYSWVRQTKSDLLDQYDELHRLAVEAMIDVENLPTQKDKALIIMSKYKDISGLVFSLLKGHDIEDSIWKMIEPKFELPFKKETC